MHRVHQKGASTAPRTQREKLEESRGRNVACAKFIRRDVSVGKRWNTVTYDRCHWRSLRMNINTSGGFILIRPSRRAQWWRFAKYFVKQVKLFMHRAVRLNNKTRVTFLLRSPFETTAGRTPQEPLMYPWNWINLPDYFYLAADYVNRRIIESAVPVFSKSVYSSLKYRTCNWRINCQWDLTDWISQ